MSERMKRRLREFDIRIIGWVDLWDPLGAQWLFEAYPDIEPNEATNAIGLDWFRSLKRDPQNTFYAITSKKQPVGIIGITSQNPVIRSAECHFILDGSITNKGIGRLIIEKGIETIFDNGFLALTVKPHTSNIAAINTAKRIGFEESDDITTMTLTRDKWESKRTSLPVSHGMDEIAGEIYGSQ